MKYWVVRIASIAFALFACYGVDMLSAGWNSYSQRIFALVGLYVTLAVSLNLINGITGQFSIGHAAFYQVGAYFAAFVTTHYFADQKALEGPAISMLYLALGLLAAVVVFKLESIAKLAILRARYSLTVALALDLVSLFFPSQGVWPILHSVFVFFFVLTLLAKLPSKALPSAVLVVAAVGGFVYLVAHFWPHVPGLVWLLLVTLGAGGAAAIAGLIVGLPSLRLRGDYLAVVTMGFGEIIRIIVENTDKIGGAYGMNVEPKFLHVGVIWLLAIICIAMCRNLLKTAHGLPFLAVREDEIASAAMGVNVTSTKVTAFVLGSAFAGAAGSLLAHYEGFISPTTFAMDTSFIILTMVVMGGTGSITGSAISAALLAYLPEYLRGLQNADGTTLAVTGASVAAALLSVAVAVGVIRKLINWPGASSKNRALGIAGSILAAALLKIAFQKVLLNLPYLANLHIEAGQLRMVIFAVSLVVIMLLRPQGIFAHHEFSWSWVMRVLFKKQGPRTAVAS